MGCDIHIFLEGSKNNVDWEFVKEIQLNRNYTLFALLSGVRGEFIEGHIALPFPRNNLSGSAHQMIEKEEGGDLHSLGMLTIEAFKKYAIKIKGISINLEWQEDDDYLMEQVSKLITELVLCPWPYSRLLIGYDS